MRRQESRLLLTFLTAGAIAVACASEEQGSDFSSKGGGASGGKASGGAAGSATTAGTTSTAGSTSTAGTGGASGGSGGTSTAGTGGTTAGTGGTAGTTAGGAGGAPSECGSGGAASSGEGVLRAEFEQGSLVATNQPGGTVHVVNDTGADMASSEFTVRYYFTSEFACDDADGHTVELYDFRRQNPHDDSVDKGDVTVSTVVVGPNGDGCDAYFEFVFTVSLDDGQYAAFNFGSVPPNNDYSGGDQTNDASFGVCATGDAWAAVPVYVDEVLTWGEEPSDGSGGAGGAGGQGGAAGAGGVAGSDATGGVGGA